MKTKLTFMIMLLAAVIASCKKAEDENAVMEKQISFKFSTLEDYDDPQFDSSYATVNLKVFKRSSIDIGEFKILDTTLSKRKLSAFQKMFPMTISKSLPLIYKKEALRGVFKITYEMKGLNSHRHPRDGNVHMAAEETNLLIPVAL